MRLIATCLWDIWTLKRTWCGEMIIWPTEGTEPLQVGDKVTMRPYGGKEKKGVVVAVGPTGWAEIEWIPSPENEEWAKQHVS